MSVLTPGQLGATFRCISPGLCASPMWQGWTLKLASVHVVKECLSTFCPYGWMEISMQTAVGCVRPKKYPPRVHTNTHTCTLAVHSIGSVMEWKTVFAGILPNIMRVIGYACTHCMSTSLPVLWVGANRKHIDEWCCSVARRAVALQRLLKCFSRLFCCKTSTERV